MCPSKRCKLDKDSEPDMWVEQIERINASIRAKVEHVFHVIKNIVVYWKTRYKGLAKNGSRLTELATMFNLLKADRLLQAQTASLCPENRNSSFKCEIIRIFPVFF